MPETVVLHSFRSLYWMRRKVTWKWWRHTPQSATAPRQPGLVSPSLRGVRLFTVRCVSSKHQRPPERSKPSGRFWLSYSSKRPPGCIRWPFI